MNMDFKTQKVNFESFTVNLRIPLDQEDEPGQRISFWFGVTSAALSLSRYIEANPIVQNKSVLELGCGLGLSGLVAAKLGARVTFSDYKNEALKCARQNALLNSVQDASFQLLDWENPTAIGKFDIIVGSEIVYDAFFHESLLSVFAQCLSSRGNILVADRPRRVVDVFLGRMLDNGYQCDEFRTHIREPGFYSQEIAVYRLYMD